MATSKKRKKAGKKVTPKVVTPAKAICPHCNEEINNIEWRPFGVNEAMVIAHGGECMGVLGVSYNFKNS
jgi:hypothetical protein